MVVNTMGLVQRVASLTVSLHVCVGKGRGGGHLKLMDWIATKKIAFNNAEEEEEM